MRLVPMNFCRADCIIVKAYSSNTFHLAPTASSVGFFKVTAYLDTSTNRDILNIAYLSQYLKRDHG